jgi:hypothetical protein
MCRRGAARGDHTVDWRFISLRMINADVDYDTYLPAGHKYLPAGHEVGHAAGLRLLRVAARARTEDGRKAVGLLDQAIGTQAFDCAALALEPEERGRRRHLVREVA